MGKAKFKKPLILAILFLLPVTFLLFLYPSTHNYNTLDIVHGPVNDISGYLSASERDLDFSDNISVLLFLGDDPKRRAIGALNVKELVYDKFKGFKRFQVIALVGEGSKTSLEELKKELYQYDQLEYWHFLELNPVQTLDIFDGLKADGNLEDDQFYEGLFILDKDLMQRGRLDDRSKNELKEEKAVYGLSEYSTIEVSELKNKLSDDLRILFTEYRQKRKGEFDSSTRRSDDIKTDE
ncbi:MAG: hypothetical protein KJO49_12380 [Bacteroidia bacterium]|nr:hypothetical protein [Bacteroidia bacterium]MBT8270230.1 hypothetical protein [Bacteroidia bacterium]NNF82557.1 hypothetical protein [Flavobacteriaceae bacterium]NNK71057.1 hypothetical protein [Flavobacteriaceae bacterium]NNL78857.1 hypothetical protein [Flavobacteriaceae bacterium]